MNDDSRRRVWRLTAGGATEHEDELAREEPLEIRVQGRPVSVTMRTPGDDEQLALGFLLSEGLLREPAEIRSVSPVDDDGRCNTVDVELACADTIDFERLTRHVFASSSCGLCGKTTIDAVHQQFPPLRSELVVEAAVLLALAERARREQSAFERTGGLHAATLFDASGNLVVLREDVGRHNAVDKVLGYALRQGLLPLDDHILLVSGRSSFEIMQKALAGRIPIVAAVSAPSSLAVEFAETSGQTLIGFLRDGRMNVYTGRQRIRFR